MRTSIRLLAAAAVLSLATTAHAQSVTTRPAYGCFKVTAPEINIRERPYSNAGVIGTAHKGDILIKRKRWCTLRGWWCAVSRGSVQGYADKNFMKVAPCPPSQSKPK